MTHHAPAVHPAQPPAPAADPHSPPTHPCVRCGAPVPVDIGLCERCNPLGLSDSASSQAHGTVFVGIVLAVVALAILGRLAVSGVGPFGAAVRSVQSQDDGLAVTIEVHNQGSNAGSSLCHVSDPANGGIGPVAIVRSPRIQPGETLTFSSTVTQLGTNAKPLAIVCDAP